MGNVIVKNGMLLNLAVVGIETEADYNLVHSFNLAPLPLADCSSFEDKFNLDGIIVHSKLSKEKTSENETNEGYHIVTIDQFKDAIELSKLEVLLF